MRQSTIPAFSVSVLTGLLLFSVKVGRGQVETPPFEIRLPSEVRSEQVQVRYFLTGPFGGNGGFLKAEPERNSYLIETSVNHQAADTLRVILYAPGCQIVTLSVASLSEAEKGADVTCEDLPPMTFNGRVDLPEALRGKPYEIEITYMAYWAHSFFRIEDGPVTSFTLARVQPDDGGAFHAELPNFNKDAMTVSYRHDAGLQFIARELDTGNIVAFLAPVNVKGNDPRALPIKPKYPAEVLFKPAAESPQNPKAGPAGKDAQ
jgi:hypothetical protein